MEAHSNCMPVGINYPWVDYGWDFGDPPLAWVGGQPQAWRAKKRQRITADLGSMAALGLFAVRWFMLADGLNYGMDRAAPQHDTERWDFLNLPPGHPFYDQLQADFEFVLKTLKELKLQFVPSLLDFHWCLPGTVVDAAQGIIKGGRAEICCDEEKRTRFFDLVLEPLLNLSLRYPETIYAWELMNEPEWVTQRTSRFGVSDRDPNHTVPERAMRDFLRDGLARINRQRLADGSPAFRSTIGFAHWQTISEWEANDLGVTLQQFHYYAQDGAPLPPCNLAEEMPCFIGEFASAAEKLWPELSEAGCPQTIAHRLRCMAGKGFHSAFLWSANAVDQATQWTQNEQQDALAYLRASSEIA